MGKDIIVEFSQYLYVSFWLNMMLISVLYEWRNETFVLSHWYLNMFPDSKDPGINFN